MLRIYKKLVIVGAFSALFAVVSVLHSSSASAAAKTWTGAAGDGLFSSASNWSPSGAPANGDTLTFNASSYGTSSPVNDISSRTFAGITVTNGTSGGSFGITFGQPTTISGPVTNSGSAALNWVGGLTLGADATFTGDISFVDAGGSYSSAHNAISLGGHTFTVTGNDGISGITTPIDGTGSVHYSDNQTVQLNAVNTYSGTTVVENTVQVYNGTSPSSSRSPSQMFGSSSLSVDASSRVKLAFSASGTYANAINLAGTTVSGNSFNAQLYIESAVNGSSFAVALSGITLSGNAGIGVTSGIASVDLAGTQANGHCVYLETIYLDLYQNAPTLCNGGGNTDPNTTTVPGVPNTGDDNKKLPVVQLAAASMALAALALGLRRKLARSS